MESGNNQTPHENLWHQQQQMSANDPNKQFYMNHYQPMQHGFDLQREITNQASPTSNTPENVHFLRDNNGPYVKIYYSDNHKEYQLFERSKMQQQQPQQETSPVFINNVDMFNNFLPNTHIPFQPPPPPIQINRQQQQNSNNNSVIHHLVTSNLGPGKFEFGTFGGHNNNNNNSAFNTLSKESINSISIPALLEHANTTTSYDSYENDSNLENGASNKVQVNMPPLKSKQQQQSQMTSNNVTTHKKSPSVSSPTVTTTYNTGSNNSGNNSKKQRIVVEVKPYKLSYSDVVSKNGISGPTTVSSSHPNSNSSSPNTTLPITTNKINKTKYQSSTAVTNNNNFEKKHQENGSNGNASDKNRKSPTNTTINNNIVNSEIKKTQPTPVKVEKLSSSSSSPPPQVSQINNNQSQNSKKKKLQTKDSLNIKSSSISTRNEAMKNKYSNTDSEEHSSTVDSDNEDDKEMENADDYYNIHKNVYHGEHHKVEKIKSFKKNKQQQFNSTSTTNVSKKNERNQKRISSKSSNRKHKSKFLEKLIASCIEYLLIFVKWLWMLIYDVGYLSVGILWDRLNLGYQYAMQGVSYVRRELRGNPGRAFILWIKNLWKRFDSKFDKKSKWAFWRWMFKKQLNGENAKDYYKDGRLPKTAEEAMKSLLNCKEKDAYSILGVSPDCPQEQIKKHYKKIAVLVHPDKNKQAGAEEAFKVLQRSFELIGEPESRKLYDDNLAKTLNTEKAFNELNDLLIQLQTKISEAANTIRCSSCCFRHPRKPTGRKPFAARECSTCKIRHAAREGDIWAETSFFGLRWKYLALMEGNVYDITEWALCQRGALSHLQANSCVVQYKIVLGGNQNQQNQNQTAIASGDRERKKDTPVHEPQEDFFLNNIYAGQGPQQNSRRRFKKN